MDHLAFAAESVITAKIAEDFGRAETVPSLGAATASFGRTTATRLAALPGHLAYNKARGFNLEDLDHLSGICAFFDDAGVEPRIEVWSGDASAALSRHLTEAGFHAAAVNVTLHRRRGPSASETGPDSSGIAVREVVTGSDDEAVYLDTLLHGYGLHTRPGSFQQTMMTIEHRGSNLRRYLASVEGRPAAAAAVYTAPTGTYLAGAATVATMRNRGCQGALIRRRLRDAAAVANPVVVTTAVGSPSQANLERHGFRVAHTRTLWQPARETVSGSVEPAAMR
jgi:hypothetical protein